MLIHGDCLDVLTTLPDASVDMVFADLPYGVTRNKWDSQIDLNAFWYQLLHVGHAASAYVFTATQPFATALINAMPTLFRYDLIWQKSPTRFHHCRRLPLLAHEHILLFGTFSTYNPIRKPLAKPYSRKYKPGDSGPNYRPSLSDQRGEARTVTYTHDWPSTIVAASQKCEKRMHPTQKPVALIEWLIKTYTNEGDTVLDPTCGSGTTAIAAINTNRKWICVEKDADYHAVAAKRIAEHAVAPEQGTLAL